MAPRTPPKKKAPESIPKPNKENDSFRLASLAQEKLAPFTCTAVRSRYVRTPYHVNSVAEEEPNILFRDGEPDRSPLLRKWDRSGPKVREPGHEELPTEFVICPLPGSLASKRPKLMVGTSGKRACGICSGMGRRT